MVPYWNFAFAPVEETNQLSFGHPYDCASTNAITGHGHYRIHVIVSRWNGQSVNSTPERMLRIACGTALPLFW